MCIHEMWFYFTRCVDLLLEDTLPDAVSIILWPPISNACFNLFKRLCSHSRLVEYGLNNTLQTATGSFIIATALLPITIITFRISDIYTAISGRVNRSVGLRLSYGYRVPVFKGLQFI